MEATNAARSLKAIAGALLAACAIALCAAMPGQAWAAWDGTTVDTSWYDADSAANEFTIDAEAELAGLAKLVNDGTDDFGGKVIKLAAGLDLDNMNWTPIGNNTNRFKGAFDGGGFTIRNMSITADAPEANQHVGLFGAVQNATVKNLTMKDTSIDVKGGNVRAGAVVSYAYSNGTYDTNVTLNFENITVEGCSIRAEAASSSALLGGVVGYSYPANMSGITVKGLTINGKAANSDVRVAAINGYVCGQNVSDNGNTRAAFTVNGFDVENVTINAEANTVYAGGYAPYTYYGYITLKNGTIDGLKINVDSSSAFVGGLVGYFWRSDSGHTVEDVNITGIDFDVTTDYLGETRIGGMVGTSQSVATYENCTVAGKITERCSDSENPVNYHAKVGGFVGRAYTWAQTYTNCVADVDVAGSHVAGGFVGNHITNASYSSCEAKGDVSAAIAGGFAGRLTEHTYSTAVTFDSCKVSGNVSGTDFAGGFIGSTADYGWGGTTGNPYGKSVTLKNCEITGSVTGEGAVAGVVSELSVKEGADFVLGDVSYVTEPAYLPETATVKEYVAKIGDVGYTSLQDALDAAAAGSDEVTVEILSDVDLDGVDWNPVTVSAPGYPVVTVNGNDHVITNLNDMLFAGTWAGKSGLVINDLTIKDSAIVNDEDDTWGTVGVGAFIGYPQASAVITLSNCHLVDSSVEGGHWTGGLIGMAGGYNGDDGPVFMNLTITGCSVENSKITGKGSVGGVIGHGSCAAWTKLVIEDTEILGNVIASTGSSTEKAGSVMGTLGAAGQPATAAGETKVGGAFVEASVSDNTVTSNGAAITTIYGRQGTETGLLTLTKGGSYDEEPINAADSWANPAEDHMVKQLANGIWTVLPEECTVTFVANGGSEVASAKVAGGERFAKPADPTREGYAFAGWFTDEALTSKYDFASPATKDITLYAKWTESNATGGNGGGTVDPGTPVVPDKDDAADKTDSKTDSKSDVLAKTGDATGMVAAGAGIALAAAGAIALIARRRAA